VLRASGKPLVGALTGATVLRTPGRDLIYHLRASYADEVDRLVRQAASVSQSKVFAVWQDDGLGRDAFAAMQDAVKRQGLQLVGERGVQLAQIDGPGLAQAVQAAKPDALFLLCVTPCAAAVLSNAARGGVVGVSSYALSIVNGESLAKAVGPAARGTVISQVLPDPHHPKTALVRQYQQDVRQFTGRDEFSYFSLEGYVSAMVAVEAARAGAKGSLADGLRQLTKREVEGIPVSSGGNPGKRPYPVHLTMIGADGKLLN
jgi:ABC-type branched-subunit amino acid transport system substrate-binding protein